MDFVRHVQQTESMLDSPKQVQVGEPLKYPPISSLSLSLGERARVRGF
jgi:hypothetical protein